MSGTAAAALAVLVAASALAALLVVRRNRALRRRPGDVAALARCRRSGRWFAGHGVWVNDVFAFRRSPAGWNEILLWVTSAHVRRPTDEERSRLHRVGDDPIVVTFVLASGGSMAFAARAEDSSGLLGPYAGPPFPERVARSAA